MIQASLRISSSHGGRPASIFACLISALVTSPLRRPSLSAWNKGKARQPFSAKTQSFRPTTSSNTGFSISLRPSASECDAGWFLTISKCHCLLGLPQGDRQDERHVRMLALILPQYFTLLISDVESGGVEARKLLLEIKLLRKIAASGPCRRAMRKLAIDPASLIPWARLGLSNSELLSKCARSQQPAGASDLPVTMRESGGI